MSDAASDFFFEDDAVLTRSEITEPALVTYIRVADLYGRYTYSIQVPEHAESDRLVLFYGDNGRGKTTVLRLLWHLLSAARDRSHRSKIAAVAFTTFDVTLSDGTSIRAWRQAPVDGPYEITVINALGETVSSGEWPDSKGPFSDWSLEMLKDDHGFPSDIRKDMDQELHRRRYIQTLERLDAKPYYLADDRNIYSDDLQVAKGRRPPHDNARLANATLREGSPEAGNVAAELVVSMRRASALLSRMTLASTQTGSRDANTVYLEVITRLAAAQPEIGPRPELLPDLMSQVLAVADRSRPFEELHLVPEFPGVEFARTLNALGPENAVIADEVLRPFLTSLGARLDALAGAESLISTFLVQTNGFLTDKSVAFDPQSGLRIVTDDGDRLHAWQLSSGERQLVLLMCNALLASRASRLFLIDEPELSLNVKWQRRIVDALLEITRGTPVQFFIATHSIELLSNYQSNVVELINVG